MKKIKTKFIALTPTPCAHIALCICLFFMESKCKESASHRAVHRKHRADDLYQIWASANIKINANFKKKGGSGQAKFVQEIKFIAQKKVATEQSGVNSLI